MGSTVLPGMHTSTGFISSKSYDILPHLEMIATESWRADRGEPSKAQTPTHSGGDRLQLSAAALRRSRRDTRRLEFNHETRLEAGVIT